MEIDPTKLFEMPSVQQNEGDEQAMHLKLEQQVVEAPYDDQYNGSSIQFLTSSMTELGDTGIFKKIQVQGVGLCPPEDAIVTIHYNASVEDEASYIIGYYISPNRSCSNTLVLRDYLI